MQICTLSQDNRMSAALHNRLHAQFPTGLGPANCRIQFLERMTVTLMIMKFILFTVVTHLTLHHSLNQITLIHILHA